MNETILVAIGLIISLLGIIFSIILSVISLIVSIALFKISSKRQNFRILYDQNNIHASEEIFMATRRLWELYREDEENIAENYMRIMRKEIEAMEKLPKEKWGDFQRNTLHFQRKLLTQFWRNLALIMKYGLLPKKQVYATWAKTTVEIIPKILLPIEKKLAETKGVSTFDRNKEALYYIVDRLDNFY